uniref:NADH-ubiquinone oxidoreductase chain 5 n=1 Tax=Petrolisthes haswelli TaxID=1562907 RepID=A0A098GJU0_9EUCA|nr:NADH dehydrogenase subunit 5 [Petrolisthes haswelli]CEH11279.1 NADH dehydrogenase subunit 5 [Petrolisthes haswelli]
MVVWSILLSLTSMFFLLLISFFCVVTSVWEMLVNKCYIIEWEFLNVNSVSIVTSYIFDFMSLMFLGFVTFISSMVLFYSGGYMLGDKNLNRFIYLVLAFVASMGILIISPNLISILLGWDGLGLVSYALVIYYQNEKSSNAGMLTVLSNRVGDVGLLLSIGLMVSLGDWNFVLISAYLPSNSMALLVSLVVIAAMTKSAQIPFSAWLPAAMAAPTPVSALVHSSTLVTAGVYLMIRFSSALSNSVSTCLLLISCLTMFMSGLGANFEYDLKKIIALSTLSQLGVMLSILSLGFVNLAFFHLLTHALFKALLFMCAGVMIHNVKDFQDIRYMGNLSKFMPLTSMCMNLANLALCGFPFLAGFYSKDLILEVATNNSLNLIIFMLYVLSTSLTVCYTFRLIFYSMFGNFNLLSYSNISDESSTMTNPMLGLSVGAISMGSILSWLMFPEMYMICMSFFMKTLFLLVSLLGALVGYMVNLMSVNSKLFSLGKYEWISFMGSMWNLPFLSTYNLNRLSLNVIGNNFVLMDKGWSELVGGQGLFKIFTYYTYKNQILQDNKIKVFMKMFLFSLLVVLMI